MKMKWCFYFILFIFILFFKIYLSLIYFIFIFIFLTPSINDFTTALAVLHLVTLARWRPPWRPPFVHRQTVTWQRQSRVKWRFQGLQSKLFRDEFIEKTAIKLNAKDRYRRIQLKGKQKNWSQNSSMNWLTFNNKILRTEFQSWFVRSVSHKAIFRLWKKQAFFV